MPQKGKKIYTMAIKRSEISTKRHRKRLQRLQTKMEKDHKERLNNLNKALNDYKWMKHDHKRQKMNTIRCQTPIKREKRTINRCQTHIKR